MIAQSRAHFVLRCVLPANIQILVCTIWSGWDLIFQAATLCIHLYYYLLCFCSKFTILVYKLYSVDQPTFVYSFLNAGAIFKFNLAETQINKKKDVVLQRVQSLEPALYPHSSGNHLQFFVVCNSVKYGVRSSVSNGYQDDVIDSVTLLLALISKSRENQIWWNFFLIKD